MSSDNGYTIVKTPNGYAAVMYYAWEDWHGGFNERVHEEFASPFEAWDWASSQRSEYGVTFTREVSLSIAERYNNTKEEK